MSITPMVSPQFKDTGLDTQVLENMNAVTPSEDLSKAMKKEGLVQKDITVQGKNGTYTRKQWVRASEAASGDQKPAKQEEPKDDKTSKSTISFEKQDGKNGKQTLANMLSSGTSRVDIMSAAKEQGISWKENDHEGINWMRASMAIQKHMDNGRSTQPQDKSSDKTTEQPKQEEKTEQKSSVDNSDGKLQVGQTVYCDQIGNGKSKVTVAGLDGENGKITVKNSRGSEYDVPMNSLYSSKEDAENGENSIADSGSDKPEKVTPDEFKAGDSITVGDKTFKVKKVEGNLLTTVDNEGKVSHISSEYFTDKLNTGEAKMADFSEKKQSVIGKDYTKLTGEDEAHSPEGIAHNMMVGWLGADGVKNPKESDAQRAAVSLADRNIREELVYGGEERKALSDRFIELSGLSRNEVVKDIAQDKYGTPEVRSYALQELMGDNYRVTPGNTLTSETDVGGKYLVEVKITPKFGGRFQTEFVYPDGVSRKETFDSVKSVQQAADKFIKDQKSRK